jgi:hypothetical protein
MRLRSLSILRNFVVVFNRIFCFYAHVIVPEKNLIRFYSQEYDPDLPPELAAVTGVHDVMAENANSGKLDVGQSDLAKGSARVRPPIVRTAVMLFFTRGFLDNYILPLIFTPYSYSSLLFLCRSNYHIIYTWLLAIKVKKSCIYETYCVCLLYSLWAYFFFFFPYQPTGRAIQVEGGFGERLPSIDTRPPRMRDSDAIIEVFNNTCL